MSQFYNQILLKITNLRQTKLELMNIFTLITNNSFKLNCFGLTNHQTDIGKMASIYFNQLPNALDVKLSTVGKD